MRRELPTHPHIDHLKKQAKDLLDAHKRGDTEALERIVTHLPALAGRSVSQAAAAPFALHDAQSTVAREYGFPSWNELRAEVEKRARPGLPDSVLRALAGQPLPPEVTAALATAWQTQAAPDTPPAGSSQSLPLIAFRDAILTPGAIAPIMISRASSIAAVDRTLASTPPHIAVIAQRDAAVEEPGLSDLHPIGCVALVKERIASSPGVFVVVQGLWWASLEGMEPATGHPFATALVRPFAVTEDVSGDDRDALVGSLRDRAHVLAQAMPQPDRVMALLDAVRVPARLADLIVANLPCSVAAKAGYAAEPTLSQRLRAAIALCDAQLAAAPR